MEFKPFKIGKYLLLERLAMGGMAEVYRAKASGAGGFEKQLAVKRILPNYSSNEEFRRMFEYEARLSSMLTQANIVQVYDFVKSGETYLLAMEYVDGKNLRQFINKIKKIGFSLPVEFGVFIINEVCKGLEYAHKKKDDLTNRPLNIIHRDMSPQNVMLSYEGSVKIVDFGIAKAKDRVDETRSGVIKGKFGYMSPEQANGELVDHRTDIFSTGIILYELLTSRRLFSTENDMATLKLIQECVIPPPSRSNPKVTPELEKIVLKSLTKDLSLRFQTAGQFQQSLQEFLNKFYPSLSQKELSTAMHKIFKEEIETEKKRFEQIYRQSIPFSQGAKTDQDDSENESGEENSQSKSDVTRSEQEEQTGITHEVEIGDEEEDEENSSMHSSPLAKDLSISKSEEIVKRGPSKGTALRESEEEEDSEPPTEVDVSSSGDSTMRGYKEPKIEKTGLTEERTMVDDALESLPSASTPTEERTRAPRPEPKRSSSGLELRSPEDYSGKTSESSNSVRRRERSISQLNDVRSGSISPTSFNDEPNPSLTGKRESENISSTRGKNNNSSSANLKMERPKEKRSVFEGYAPDAEPDPESGWLPLARALITVTLLFVLVTGTIFLYKLYFGGKIQNVVGAFVPREDNQDASPQVRPNGGLGNRPPAQVVVQPNRAAATQCTLNIDSDPRGASISIDEQASGTTPATLLLECRKSFSVSIKQNGYEPIVQNVFLKSNSERMYRTLAKIPQGGLELTITPGAMVDIPELGYSKYIPAGQPVSFTLRANRVYKVRFHNEVLGINVTREFSVPEDKMVRNSLSLNQNPGNR